MRPFLMPSIVVAALAALPACGGCNDDADPPVVAAGSGEGSAEVAPTPTPEALSPEEAHADALALVDGRPVLTRDSLDAEITDMVDRYERMPERGATTAAWRNERRRRLVQSAVWDGLIDAYVDAQDIEIGDDAVDTYLAQRLQHVYTDEDLFARFLETEGMSREAYVEATRRELKVDAALAARGELEPSEDDVRGFYEQNRERWQEGERVLASAITVRVRTNAAEPDVAAAREVIDALRERVTSGGEAFADVARAESETADAGRGGDLGWIVKDRRRQLVEDGTQEVLFGAPIGSVTEPQRTRLGWQIYQVRDRRPAGPRDYDEIAEILREPIRRRNRQRLRADLARELMEQAEIVYLEDNWGLEEETDPEPSEEPTLEP